MANRVSAAQLAIGVALILTLSTTRATAQVQPAEGLKWADAGVPGVSTAVVQGDMTKGASHFYLRYPAGFVSPVHHHSPDHFATTVSGSLSLTMDGKEHRLSPGSYFAFTGKAPHVARCAGPAPCVMFIDARGAWDVVLEQKAPVKP
jgi:quercetin dioxygenase-like cupin family protein